MIAMVLAATTIWAAGQAAPELPDLATAEPQVAALIRETHETLAAAPGDAERWGRYGMVLDVHAFIGEAIAAYGQAEQLDDAELRWPYLRAILLAREQPEVALGIFRRAATLDDANASLYVRMGALLERQGEADAAQDAYRRAIEVRESSPYALAGLGQLLLEDGRLDEAKRNLDRAVEIFPQCKPALSGLATHARMTGDLDAARRYAEAAAEAPEGGPRDPIRREVEELALSTTKILQQVQALRRAGQLDVARTRLETLLEGNPDSARARSQLGELDLEAGRVLPALDQFVLALEADPAFVPARLGHAHATRLAGRVADARTQYEAIIAEHPTAVRAYTGLAACLAAQRDADGAAEQFRQALDLAPDDRRARVGYGWILMSKGRFDEALEHVRPVADETGGRPDNVRIEANVYAGQVLLRVDRAADAIPYLQRAVSARPNRANLRQGLARALAAADRDVEAVQVLEEGLRGTPGAMSLQVELVRLLATSGDTRVRDGARAVSLAERLANATRRSDPGVLELLACAYAESGRFEEALAAIGEARTLATKSFNDALVEHLDGVRRRLQANEPCP